MSYVDEKIVLDFYLNQMEENNIKFLEDNREFKQLIAEEIGNLKGASTMHDKIEVSKRLWKLLFESAMSYIDPDKRGYDELFKYFDEYVNFEELIFASDSFYRDHTLHCLWVYFLGEYMFYNKQYSEFIENMYFEMKTDVDITQKIAKSRLENLINSYSDTLVKQIRFLETQDAIRCISALTHDLGYPLKKIHKINSCISKILPYYAIHNYDEFNFNYSGIQENYIHNFLDLMNVNFGFNFDSKSLTPQSSERHDFLFKNLFITKEGSNYILDLNMELIDTLSDEDKEILKGSMNYRIDIKDDIEKKLRYSNDFEQYQHGIMSAFLLAKTVNSFTSFKFIINNKQSIKTNQVDVENIQAKVAILNAVSDHTSAGFQIRGINTASEYLALIDELEEFSRISRANQNRQYVIEFCKTSLSSEDGVLQVDFIFDNENIADLDPEKAFKGRCKRFLNLFNIKELDDKLKIRLRCISKLSYNDNIYTLEIGRKYAKISINDVEQSIPKYLSSRQFYTREQYQKM